MAESGMKSYTDIDRHVKAKGVSVMKETIVIGSVTYAIKSKRELAQRGIHARVVRASKAEGSSCIYGIEIDTRERMRVQAILDELSIAYQRGHGMS